MTTESPLLVRWDGEAFHPANQHWSKRADREYCVGEVYRMAPLEERSMRSHRQYFASINEAWQNLPEHLAERFPTADHLRKHALIRAGYRDEQSFACSSRAEALRIAAFIRPIDDYALVVVRDAVVIRYTAKSQSQRAMGKKDFGESKEAVLNVLSDMIGVRRPELEANAGRAA